VACMAIMFSSCLPSARNFVVLRTLYSPFLSLAVLEKVPGFLANHPVRSSFSPTDGLSSIACGP